MATKRELERALADLGITGLRLAMYAGGGVVVDDGHELWTCRSEALLGAAETLLRGGRAVAAGEDQAAVYTALCRRAGYLARGSAEDRALHERIVQGWREDNPGFQGNWA